MEIGFVGLGRMGVGMTRRLLERGHDVVGYDLDEAAVRDAEDHGVRGAGSLEDLVETLAPSRAVWVMVPHGEPTRTTVSSLADLLEPGDLLVDGGNSRWTESLSHAAGCRERNLAFLDVGVSGGVWGYERGFNMMVGGPSDAVRRLEPILEALAPEDGYAHVGENGAGHFVKMIHNAIEYGMLQAIGEGFECLHRSDFDLDLRQVAELWQHGAVVRCWLLELLVAALEGEGNELERIEGWVEDSGTGRWTVEYAVDRAVPIPALTASLYERFDSRVEDRFAHQVIAALRNQFGGHAVREDGEGTAERVGTGAEA